MGFTDYDIDPREAIWEASVLNGDMLRHTLPVADEGSIGRAAFFEDEQTRYLFLGTLVGIDPLDRTYESSGNTCYPPVVSEHTRWGKAYDAEVVREYLSEDRSSGPLTIHQVIHGYFGCIQTGDLVYCRDHDGEPWSGPFSMIYHNIGMMDKCFHVHTSCVKLFRVRVEIPLFFKSFRYIRPA